MSEQEKATGYKQELQAWAKKAVITPLLDRGPDAIGEVQEAIWQKVLQSYRNGQRTGIQPERGVRHAAKKTG